MNGRAHSSARDIPGRDPARHARMQSKLVGRAAPATHLERGTAAANGRGTSPVSTAKLTPLEQQVGGALYDRGLPLVHERLRPSFAETQQQVAPLTGPACLGWDPLIAR